MRTIVINLYVMYKKISFYVLYILSLITFKRVQIIQQIIGQNKFRDRVISI